MESIYENFDISLGIKKNKKFITIKNTQKVQDLEKDEENLKINDLKEILKKHKENTEKLKKENEKLEKQIKEMNKNMENEKKLLIKQNKIMEKNNKKLEKKNKIIVNICNKNKKKLLNELKKYFKIKNFDVLNELKNIDFELEKSNYDTFELAYSDNYKYNEYCNLLK